MLIRFTWTNCMQPAGSSSIYLSRQQPNFGIQYSCSSSIDCASLALVERISIVVDTGILLLLVTGLVCYVAAARTRCSVETRRTRREAVAFDRFATRVRDVDPVVSRTAAARVGSVLVATDDRTGSGRRIREITATFRDTVMSVPHYDEEYGESLAEHMAIEFGDELTIAVVETRQFTPQVKQGLYRAAIAARDRRLELLSVLEAESNALQTFERELTDLTTRVEALTEPLRSDQTYDELCETYRELNECTRACEALLHTRQTQRTDGHAANLPYAIDDLQEYLYERFEVTYPVLSDGLQLYRRITTARGRLEDELLSRA